MERDHDQSVYGYVYGNGNDEDAGQQNKDQFRLRVREGSVTNPWFMKPRGQRTIGQWYRIGRVELACATGELPLALPDVKNNGWKNQVFGGCARK